MDKRKLENFRQRLLEEKKELEGRIKKINNGLKDPMADSIGELSMYDNHPADIGDELFERGKDLSLRDSAEIQYKNVERALAKIDNNTYGICDKCGKPISIDRLEALPSANLCLDCKKEEVLPDGTDPLERSSCPLLRAKRLFL